MRHMLSEIDEDARRAKCSVCGPVKISNRGLRKGNPWFRCKNTIPRDIRVRTIRYGYSREKGKNCERCGFVPDDPCQLDVHHHKRDKRFRITLCANCHRLVTKWEREGRLIARAKLKLF